MSGTIGIIGGGGRDNQLSELIRNAGLRPVTLQADQLTTPTKAMETPDVVLVDVRQDLGLMSAIASVKRRFAAMPVAIVTEVLDPAVMLEAMRAGVTEVLTDPITQSSLEASLGRLIGQRGITVQGHVSAIIGAKGGVGATTIAVNTAEALAKNVGEALLIDLNLASGDAAVFLGVEPRFTILEALENTHRLDEAFLRSLVVHTKSGLDLLASSTRIVPGGVDPQKVRRLIDFASGYYRHIILDVPRLDLTLMDSLEACASVFVVVNQELPTVRSAHRLVSMLRQRYGERVSVLVNREDRLSEITIADVTKAVNAQVSFTFPNDYRKSTSAANKGQPIASAIQGKMAEAFHSFARTLTGRAAKARAHAVEAPGGGIFGWLAPRKSTS